MTHGECVTKKRALTMMKMFTEAGLGQARVMSVAVRVAAELPIVK